MSEYIQTKTGKGGNCFETCVAYILGINPDEVPDFGKDKKWFFRFKDWAYSKGYGVIYANPPDGADVFGVDFIAGGYSPRGLIHAAVYRANHEGTREMIHDPHPEGGGIDKIHDVIVLIPRKDK